MRLLRKAVKHLLRRAGIDIRFIPPLGFDAYEDMRKLAATERPLVFDVGANRGQTIERFRDAFAQPVIHTFEPGREAFAALQRRCAGIPDLHLNNAALGARAESRMFLENTRDDMSSFLEPSVDAWGEIADRYPVDVTTVDSYCAAHGIERIDILKSDTQGLDLDVLRGAQRMIDSGAIGLVFMEITFSDMYKGSPRFDEIYAFLADRRFALVSFYDFYYQRGRAGWTDALFMAEADGGL
ncbi:MAG TPA: FkbM family methyltransferase [Thermoanaerobaculia bacterium]